MIGRGTRLCRDLFGPDEDKKDFRVFDFCFNFDFFNENPKGIESSGSLPIGTRLFRSRITLLQNVQSAPELDPDQALADSLTNMLHGEVVSMNRENFIVRMHLKAVDRFRKREAWGRLDDVSVALLESDISNLPSEMETDNIEARMFDLTALRMQLALSAGDNNAFESHRKRVLKIAALLEEKTAIPAVQAQLEYLRALQDIGFWEGMDLNTLEDLRLRMRGLVVLLDKKERKPVYTDFQDEITNVREHAAVYMPKMTSTEYERRVKSYLGKHQDHLVVRRLRANKPLTTTDLKGLEETLVEIGDEDGETLLSGLLDRSAAPSLAHFVRSLVGLDRSTAQSAFSEFLNDHSLTPPQIRFVEMLVDQLTNRGVMDASALYEAPFSHLHTGGPDALFSGKENVIEGLFKTLKTVEPGFIEKSG